MKRFFVLVVLSFASVWAAAQAFPNKPITMVVPYPPGGTTDAMGRITALRLSAELGVPVIVENRGGASGTIGSQSVRRATPDGYTLLFNASIFLLGKNVLKATPYDPASDFVALARVGHVPLVLLANPLVTAPTLTQLVSQIKANPDGFNFANSAAGSAGHLASLEFNRLAGTNVPVISYRGSSPALTDLIGGQVQLMFDPVGVAVQHVRAGKLRALAITSGERSEAIPEVPSAVEAGMPELKVFSWYGVWGPRDLPADVLTKLDQAFAAVGRDEEMSKRVKAIGVTPLYENRQVFGAFVAADIKRNAALLAASGFQPE